MKEKPSTHLIIDLQEFLDDLPHLSSAATYWLVRANKGDFYTDFAINSYIGIGWNEVTLDEIKSTNGSVDVMKNIIAQHHPNLISGDKSTDKDLEDELLQATEEGDEGNIKSSVAISSMTSQLLRFTNQLHIGDIVIVPNKGSNLFLVGRITSEPHEVDPTSDNDNELTRYLKSGYKKRLDVDWIGRFSRDNADSSLYKMIFSQHTISIVNDYAAVINRAVFDAYVLDESELHLTYHVTADTDINAGPLGQFLYLLSDINGTLTGSDSDLKIKINVQSPGPAESTTHKLLAGAVTFALIFCVGVVGYAGGEVTYENGKLTFKSSGFAEQIRENKDQDAKLEKARVDDDTKTLNNETKAYNLAKETGVPISELGIELPARATKALQKQVDEYRAEQKKEASKKDEPDINNSDVDSDTTDHDN
ncbi:hypothetical protein [Lacticaseibacillus paracasei]|uniref:hypothetical protein n=1 Tax=Lacticaseibacillus paracasei TaxID=1597 RepID=UPI0021C46EBB|nr:hypothetical protein [Lacticaseibacillus paracasei]MCP9305293.1 hypothetical protein [Lacticaseibacillus paracasei]